MLHQLSFVSCEDKQRGFGVSLAGPYTSAVLCSWLRGLGRFGDLQIQCSLEAPLLGRNECIWHSAGAIVPPCCSAAAALRALMCV